MGLVCWNAECKIIHDNTRLKIKQGVYFFIPERLFNAYILQNFRLEDCIRVKQKAAKELSIKS